MTAIRCPFGAKSDERKGGIRIACHLTFHWSRRGGRPAYAGRNPALAAPRLSSSVLRLPQVPMSLHEDIVHTIFDWYDGPRSGAATFLGEPVWYRSVYLDGDHWDPDEDRFELTALTQEALGWELEREAIFLRWNAAYRSEEVSWQRGDDDSWGALPHERGRYRTVSRMIDDYLAAHQALWLARGEFEPASQRVHWHVLGPAAEPSVAADAEPK